MTLPVLILALVTLQRVSELVIARRNTTALMANGGKEVAAGHYPAIVLLHAIWLIGLWYLARHEPVNWAMLLVYAVLQLGRLWVLLSLGRRWTTRIIVVPGETLVAKGPYRFIRHPNYAIVALEIPILPLVFGLTEYAFVFGAINLAVLGWRIRAEEAALAKSN